MTHEQLYRIVYYSRNCIDDNSSLSSEIRSILAASQKNNAPVGITGALMFNAGCFAQVLEGNRDVLESTFERIQRDPRHDDVQMLAFETIKSRIFGEWSMGYFGRNGRAELADISASSGFDPSKVSGDHIVGALQRLAFEEEPV